VARLVVRTHAPEGYKAVLALDTYLQRTLDPVLLELVKLRASQINGCSFCIDMHATFLEQSGVPPRKIHGVNAWGETPFFTPTEEAALALTEEVTLLPGGVSDTTWDRAAAIFSETELSNLILAIGTINLWNRIGVTTHQQPAPLGD
jgi:AhpD family alkylhydroperoxidase